MVVLYEVNFCYFVDTFYSKIVCLLGNFVLRLGDERWKGTRWVMMKRVQRGPGMIGAEARNMSKNQAYSS